MHKSYGGAITILAVLLAITGHVKFMEYFYQLIAANYSLLYAEKGNGLLLKCLVGINL